MNKCMLFFDIDGTILLEDGSRSIPESTKEAIAKARAAGHMTFINTGRVYLNVESMIRDLGFDGFVCGCGTNIYYQGEELFHHTLPKKQCREIAEVVRRCQMSALYEAADLNSYDSSAQLNDEMQELIEYFSKNGRPMCRVEDPEFHFDKFTAWYPLSQDIREFKEYIRDTFDFIDRGHKDSYGMCEIVPKGLSKGSGIAFLREYFHGDLEDCYAFGDSTNDLPMLEYVTHSVAMGGSCQQVKEAVEYVTDDIEQDGLAKAMAHYHLI